MIPGPCPGLAWFGLVLALALLENRTLWEGGGVLRAIGRRQNRTYVGGGGT